MLQILKLKNTKEAWSSASPTDVMNEPATSSSPHAEFSLSAASLFSGLSGQTSVLTTRWTLCIAQYERRNPRLKCTRQASTQPFHRHFWRPAFLLKQKLLVWINVVKGTVNRNNNVQIGENITGNERPTCNCYQRNLTSHSDQLDLLWPEPIFPQSSHMSSST